MCCAVQNRPMNVMCCSENWTCGCPSVGLKDDGSRTGVVARIFTVLFLVLFLDLELGILLSFGYLSYDILT